MSSNLWRTPRRNEWPAPPETCWHCGEHIDDCECDYVRCEECDTRFNPLLDGLEVLGCRFCSDKCAADFEARPE